MKERIKNVVLVHGAFADGSGWEAVATSSRMMGTRCRWCSTRDPYAEDIKYTKAAIDAMAGPVVLVGHSYGGSVITEAGNHPNAGGACLYRRIRAGHWRKLCHDRARLTASLYGCRTATATGG